MGKKKGERNYVKVQSRKVNMRGERKVELSWSSPLRCPPLGLPLQRQTDFLPSFSESDTILVQVDLPSSIFSILAVSHTRGSRTLIHLTRFPNAPSLPLHLSKSISFLDSAYSLARSHHHVLSRPPSSHPPMVRYHACSTHFAP